MQPFDRAYLSPDEFAAMSGLSLATVYRRIKRGQLPVVQPGGPRTRLLIPIDALDRLHAGSEQTNESSTLATSAVAPDATTPPPPPRRRGRRPRLGRAGGHSNGDHF